MYSSSLICGCPSVVALTTAGIQATSYMYSNSLICGCPSVVALELAHANMKVVMLKPDLRFWLVGLADNAVEGRQAEADWAVHLAVLALLG